MTDSFAFLAAAQWREILSTDPQELFGPLFPRLLNRHPDDLLPQPGYVGSRYRPGGFVFVGMNPGGGKQQGLGASDRDLYRALTDLQKAGDHVVVGAFTNLTTLLESRMKQGRIIRNFVQPILACTGLELGQIAYLNLLKWRTRPKAGLSRLYDISWKAHTRAQIELLDPRIIVSLGVGVGRALKRHYCGGARCFAIPRVIGDGIGPNGKLSIRKLCAWLNADQSRTKRGAPSKQSAALVLARRGAQRHPAGFRRS